MGGDDAAWRYFNFNWWPIALMGAALALSLVLTDSTIGLAGFVVTGAFVATYAGFAYANAFSPARRDLQVFFALGGTAQLVLITALMTPLTYLRGR